MEQWKAIPDTEEKLYISNHGRVKSYLRNKIDGYILTPTKDAKGYLRLRVTLKGKKISYKIHRIVAEAFIPNPLKKQQVNHVDGNKANNTIANLEWCSNMENSQHAINNGLWQNVFAASARTNESRKTAVIATDIRSGAETAFESVSAAERYYNNRHISDVLNGKRHQAAGQLFRREVM